MIVFCFCIVACISVFAQEMAVKTFEAKPAYELTGTEVQRDGNGEVDFLGRFCDTLNTRGIVTKT